MVRSQKFPAQDDAMAEQDTGAGMNAADLYIEEVFTDRRVGTIQRLTPVTPDGSADGSRPVVYVGQAQIMTPAGALPLSFEIPAASLAAAVEGFGDAAERAVQETMQRLQELRREAAGSIILPESGGGLGGMPGRPGGGGKIRMP
jgi:hypothetical protein